MGSVDVSKVTSIIREVAAEYIIPRFRNLKANEIAYKGVGDPVTIADRESESALSERLLDLLQGSNVVGEEAFAFDKGVLDRLFGESPVWIIDPIDGTINFAAGIPQYGVIVALAEQNQAIAGWIYDPTSDEIITTERGSGAWYKNQRLSVLPAKPLSEMHGFLGDRLIDSYKNSKPTNLLGPSFDEMNACSHEYPRLLLGGEHFGKNKPQAHFRASLYYSTPWDDAAGILMHEEAGGFTSHWDGSPYRPSAFHRGLMLAPDRDSWQELRAWCLSFTKLPMAS